MFDWIRVRYRVLHRRIYRLERREVYELRQWIRQTNSIVHVSVVLFVPFLIGTVTWLFTSVEQLSFFLFPPLASGIYTLFSDPRGQHASAWKFVVGLTVGAVCGLVVLQFSATFLYHVQLGQFHVSPDSAALSVLLTAIATWALDVEEPSAFSTALLVLVVPTDPLDYVVAVALSTLIVAVVFTAWRDLFYNQRGQYFQRSVEAKHDVLVPVVGGQIEVTAMFASRLTAATSDGRVVLLDMVSEETAASTDGDEQKTRSIHGVKERIESETRASCEIYTMVAEPSSADTILNMAVELGSDLVVTPLQKEHGRPLPQVQELFDSDFDVIAFQPGNSSTRWERVLVPVRKAGTIAQTMLGAARRVAGDTGRVSVCSCISRSSERRPTERMLSGLVETIRCPCETHVARATIDDYLSERARNYDLLIIGASTDRSTASRWLSPPTFERLDGVDCDIAVIHSNQSPEP